MESKERKGEKMGFVNMNNIPSSTLEKGCGERWAMWSEVTCIKYFQNERCYSLCHFWWGWSRMYLNVWGPHVRAENPVQPRVTVWAYLSLLSPCLQNKDNNVLLEGCWESQRKTEHMANTDPSGDMSLNGKQRIRHKRKDVKQKTWRLNIVLKERVYWARC